MSRQQNSSFTCAERYEFDWSGKGRLDECEVKWGPDVVDPFTFDKLKEVYVTAKMRCIQADGTIKTYCYDLVSLAKAVFSTHPRMDPQTRRMLNKEACNELLEQARIAGYVPDLLPGAPFHPKTRIIRGVDLRSS